MEGDAEIMAHISGLNAKNFRTMLKFMSGGMHFKQACELIALRSKTGLELLADDVNTVLARCVFTTEAEAIPLIVTNMKKAERLLGRTDEQILAEATAALEITDTGEVPNLAHERRKRSPEMHDPEFRARMRAEEAAANLQAATRVVGFTESHTSSCAETCGHVVGQKRPRPDDTDDTPALDNASDSAAAAGASAASGAPAALTKAQVEEIEHAAFKKALDVLNKALRLPAGRYAPNRYARARDVFSRCESDFGLAPNARTYVLLLYGALAAGLVDEAKTVMAMFLASGAVAGPQDLYLHMQPAFMRRLVDAGVLEDSPALLEAPYASDKWCFLKAAAEAALGDQLGSKHGSVLRKGGAVLAFGHNHRYGVPGDKHLRVMHAEVHALVKVAEARKEREAALRAAKEVAGAPAPEGEAAAAAAGAGEAAVPVAGGDDDGEPNAAGSECFIVELDGRGVGYEEATPCSMCQTGLCQLGVSHSHFSSHAGLVSVPVTHRPNLFCDTYSMALRRTYPKGSRNPDLPEAAAAAPAAV